jgi:hypothetical protein
VCARSERMKFVDEWEDRMLARLGVPFAGRTEAEPGAVAKPQSSRAASSITLSWEDGCGTRARME